MGLRPNIIKLAWTFAIIGWILAAPVALLGIGFSGGEVLSLFGLLSDFAQLDIANVALRMAFWLFVLMPIFGAIVLARRKF